jgi:hypothetical protein
MNNKSISSNNNSLIKTSFSISNPIPIPQRGSNSYSLRRKSSTNAAAARSQDHSDDSYMYSDDAILEEDEGKEGEGEEGKVASSGPTAASSGDSSRSKASWKRSNDKRKKSGKGTSSEASSSLPSGLQTGSSLNTSSLPHSAGSRGRAISSQNSRGLSAFWTSPKVSKRDDSDLYSNKGDDRGGGGRGGRSRQDSDNTTYQEYLYRINSLGAINPIDEAFMSSGDYGADLEEGGDPDLAARLYALKRLQTDHTDSSGANTDGAGGVGRNSESVLFSLKGKGGGGGNNGGKGSGGGLGSILGGSLGRNNNMKQGAGKSQGKGDDKQQQLIQQDQQGTNANKWSWYSQFW